MKGKQLRDAERAMFFALRIIQLNGGRVKRAEVIKYMRDRKIRAADAGLRMAFSRRYLELDADRETFVVTQLALQDFTKTFEEDRKREASVAEAVA